MSPAFDSWGETSVVGEIRISSSSAGMMAPVSWCGTR